VNAVSSADVNGDNIPDVLAVNGQDGRMVMIPGIGSRGVGSGFFDDANVTLVRVSPGPVRQTVFMGATTAFAVGVDGSVFRFNPSTGASAAVFTPPPGREVNALQPFAPGGGGLMLFTANRDGSVSVLLPQAGGLRAVEQAVVASAGLSDPSA